MLLGELERQFDVGASAVVSVVASSSRRLANIDVRRIEFVNQRYYRHAVAERLFDAVADFDDFCVLGQLFSPPCQH